MRAARLIGTILVATLALAACGGGGGGSSPAPAPAPTATANNGFVPASGPITALASVNGSFGSTLLASSAAAVFAVVSASQPATPRDAGAVAPDGLAQVPVSITETQGLSTASVLPQSYARPSAQEIAAAHRDFAANSRRELPATKIRIDRVMATLPRLPAGIRVPQARIASHSLGEQHSFNILYVSPGTSLAACPLPNPIYQCAIPITATLEAVSQHAYIWVDNDSLNTPGEFPDPSYFTTAASNFDQYFAIETQAFGPAFSTANVTQYGQCDQNANPLPASQYEPAPDMTGADPHVHIVITDVVSGVGESGYFFPGDLIAQQVLNCSAIPRPLSNELPMVVIGGDNYQPANGYPEFNPQFWLNSDMPRLLSHELQHFLHSMNKYYNPLANGRQTVIDEPWIDEGCSMLAEDLAANGTQIDTPQYSYLYLLEPSEFSLTAFVGFQPDPTVGSGPYFFQYYTAGNYGAAYLFLRYVYDRFGGNAALHALYGDFRPATPGLSNVNPILAAIGNSESWSQLYGEWSIAVAAQSAGITTDPRYGFGPEVVLRGTVEVPSRRGAPLGTRTFVFGGPQPPEQFDAAGNLIGYVKLGTASSPNIGVLDGAANFFLTGAAVGGATIRAQSGTLNAAQGALVQGKLPTPPPNTF